MSQESEMKNKLSHDLISALKRGDAVLVQTLRLVLTSLHNREIEKRGKKQDDVLTDEEVIEVIGREAKKRKEAIELYLKGGRPELAEKEKNELKVLEAYLPKQFGEEEVRKIVRGVISHLPNEKNFGKLMGEAMKELKGKADAKLVSEILKAELQ